MARLGERWAFEEALVSTLNGPWGQKSCYSENLVLRLICILQHLCNHGCWYLCFLCTPVGFELQQ